MMKSKRTIQLTKKRNLFLIFSLVLLAFCVVYSFAGIISHLGATPQKSVEISSDKNPITAYLLSLATTTLIAIFLSVLIKDKARTLLYMLCLIISSVVHKETGMYVVLGCWFLDEYVFFALFSKFKNLVTINKEIDLRENANEC